MTWIDPMSGEVVSDDPVTSLPPEMRGLPAVAELHGRQGRREVYGYVYELFTTRPDLDGEHPYVGMTTERTIHRRVHGPKGHTSPASVAKDSWKARIRKGSAGYRRLETVYATGDPEADEASLRRAEAFWIDRIRPKHNAVRPVRPARHEQVTFPARPKRVQIARPPSKRAEAAAKARARTRRRVSGFLLLFVAVTAVAAWFILSMGLPWPAAPWVASPVAGLLGAVPTFQYLDRKIRRITGRRR